jgi:hypothetical protein
MWCVYTIEYQLATKNEIMLFAGKWMKLESIMLRKVITSEGQRLHVSLQMLKLNLKDKCIHKYIYDP